MQTKQLKYLTVAAASVLIVSVAYAADKPADSTKEPSGATFAHTCAACHGTYGYSNDSAFPGLAGMDRQVFVREMKRFRSKERPSSIMSHIADGYNDAELERMAAFFAALPKKAPEGKTPAATSQPSKGETP